MLTQKTRHWYHCKHTCPDPGQPCWSASPLATVVYLMLKNPQEETPDTPSAHQTAAGRWSPIWRIWPEAMLLKCKALWAAHDPAPDRCLCMRDSSANTDTHLRQRNPASALAALQPCVYLTRSQSWDSIFERQVISHSCKVL